MSTVKLFIKQCVALIKGDDAEVTAQKIQRKADSVFKTEIAACETELIEKQEALEEAKENLAKALMNQGDLITDKQAYVGILIDSKNAVVDCEDAIQAVEEKIKFLKEQKELVNA